MENTTDDWIHFGIMYDRMVEEGIVPNLVTMSTEESTYYGIHISDTDGVVDYDVNSITEWYVSPLEAIKATYFFIYMGGDINEVVNNLSMEDLDDLNNITNASDYTVTEVIATLLKRAIYLHKEQCAIEDDGEQDCSCNCAKKCR